MNPETLPDGTIIAWCIVDHETLVPCVQCSSRAQARALVKPEPGEEPWGLVCKLVKVH